MAVEEPPMREDAAQVAPCQHREGVPGGGATPPGALTPRGPAPLLPDGSAKGAGHDDELTSLSWLQDTNLLRKLAGPPSAASHQGNGMMAAGSRSSGSATSVMSAGEEDESREWGPPGQVPYNPQVHVTSKPPYSFSCLIFMAIEESAGKALPVKDIYAWILGHFPYFQRAPTGWKNSVRHNLSLNKCFRKVDKDKGQNIGKGSLWCIDPEFRPNLLQAMRKTPCFPYTQLNWAGAPSTPHSVPSQDNSDQALSADPSQAQNNVPSPYQDVDAAATMLSLQNGPNILPPPSDDEDDDEEEGYRDSSPPSPIVFTKKHLRLQNRSGESSVGGASTTAVITSSPSEDHTYSASLANGNSSSGDLGNGASIAITSVRSLVPGLRKDSEQLYDDNPQEENSNGSAASSNGGGGLGRLPLSSVPPRKRRAALAAAAALPRKSKRTASTAATTTRRSSGGSAALGSSSSADRNDDMAEGAAHALLNLAKVASSQQLILQQGKNSSTGARERR
ncbi:forkhead box protein N3-like isoform X2 [Amblyomma americanum]